jgi:DNA-binding transcriptional ArsR family regulator
MPLTRNSSAQLFAALGDETRLGLTARLCAKGPQSITELTAGSRVTRQGITKHLRVMERSGLAHCTPRGRESLWEVDRRSVEEARRYLEQISRHWDKALARLQAFVKLIYAPKHPG